LRIKKYSRTRLSVKSLSPYEQFFTDEKRIARSILAVVIIVIIVVSGAGIYCASTMGSFSSTSGSTRQVPNQIFYRVSLRMVIPGIVAALILSFIFCWNELLHALVITYSPFSTGAQTVPLFLKSFIVIQHTFNWGGLAAARIFTMLTIINGDIRSKVPG